MVLISSTSTTMEKDDIVEDLDAEQPRFCKKFLDNLVRSKKHKDIVSTFYDPPGAHCVWRVDVPGMLATLAWKCRK